MNDIEIAKAKRDYELKQAEFDYAVNVNQAKADFAYALQVHNILAIYFFSYTIWWKLAFDYWLFLRIGEY